jgi:PAS domain S-box-containing protein
VVGDSRGGHHIARAFRLDAMRSKTTYGLRRLVVFICIATWATLPLQKANAAPSVKESKRVLVFYEATLSYPGIALIDREIRAALQQSPYNIEFYSETLEEFLLADDVSKRDMGNAYIRKYRYHQPDLIIAEGVASIEFMVNTHDNYFRGVPVVFCGATPEQVKLSKLGADFTGIWFDFEPNKALDMALQLRPGTRHIVVIGGVSFFERRIEESIKEQLKDSTGKPGVSYLTGLTLSALLDQVSHLQKDSIVLFIDFVEDAAGKLFVGPTQSLPAIAAVANAPVFVVADTEVGSGAVGGYVMSYLEQGRIAGATAVRILQGDKPQNIPIVKGTDIYEFDWAALHRWDVNTSRLPPGSLVLNRQPTVWEAYRGYIVGGIIVCLGEMLLILGLLWQRAKRKRVEESLASTVANLRGAESTLRESEQRFRLVANTAPVLIWMSGVDKLCIYFNKPWLEFTGRSFEEELGNGWAQGVHHEDLQACLTAYIQAFDRREAFQMEYRLRRYDGEYRWILDNGIPRFNADGSFAGYIGSAIDVSEQKLAQQAIRTVGGRLLEAQDAERKRIARELHDDISQRLALLAIEIAQADSNVNGSPERMKAHLEGIRQHCSNVAHDVQTLSHRLHNSKMDFLGVVHAVRVFCNELSKQYEVRIDFNDQNVPKNLPSNIALCLFRVVQEALHNAVKYSGVKEFTVELSATANEVHLLVTDTGAGFDVEKMQTNPGLGLVSMQERVHMVQGRFNIESRQGEGTKVVASVPLPSESSTVRGTQAASVPGTP